MLVKYSFAIKLYGHDGIMEGKKKKEKRILKVSIESSKKNFQLLVGEEQKGMAFY